MGKGPSVKTSPKATTASVRQKSGRTYVVKGSEKRPVSIRNQPHWQLGAVERGSLFHAMWREGEWYWGLVQEHGSDPLTYKDHARCGWIWYRNLRKPKKKVKFLRPPSYKTWEKKNFNSIVKLYLNLEKTKQPVGAARKNGKLPFKGYYNCGAKGSTVGSGGEIDVQWPVAVRYLNDRGWYMARRADLKHGDPEDRGWFFIHSSHLVDPPSERPGDRLSSAKAEARFRKQVKKRKSKLIRITAR